MVSAVDDGQVRGWKTNFPRFHEGLGRVNAIGREILCQSSAIGRELYFQGDAWVVEMDDGYHRAFGAHRLKEEPNYAALTANPEELRRVWDLELHLEVHSSVQSYPEEVNARSPEICVRIKNGEIWEVPVGAPTTNLFSRA